MADVVVIATARAKPGKEKELERALREVTQPTRHQPGCVRFSLFRSEEDAAVIVGVERWKSKEDHQRHLQGKHFKKLATAMGDIVAGPPQISWYEIIEDE
jgi:quinol monooxygenase YgiN